MNNLFYKANHNLVLVNSSHVIDVLKKNTEHYIINYTTLIGID